MAKALAMKNDDDKPAEGGKPDWLTWPQRKVSELGTFFREVRSELKKVTWPAKKEVYATTVVVIVTTLFFGFYLWFLDLGLSWLYEHTVGTVGKV
jgi:preprotein translocase subunit SecE